MISGASAASVSPRREQHGPGGALALQHVARHPAAQPSKHVASGDAIRPNLIQA